ncbi:MAG: acyl carrier protein [Desulfovibrio sp.]|nr:acyl carrier protein [Desulfovibrio sp.]
MDQASIISKVNQALTEEFEIDSEKFVPTSRIKEDLGLDSLDIVDLVVILEKTFQMKLPDRQALAQIETLGDLYNFLFELQKKLTFKP